MGSAVEESRNFCEHMTARQLTRWKYWVVANFYLTSWVTHPTRAFRVASNVIRGRQTSVLEKFLGDAVRRVIRRVPLPAAHGRDARPLLPY
jgi:hypothetical protein